MRCKMETRYFLGLDVAKDTFVAVLLNEDGLAINRGSFANTLEGFAALVAWLPNAARTIAVCEPTGVYNQRLKHALAAALESLHEINAKSLRAQSFSQVRTKTDEADALMIAEAARTLFLCKPEILRKTRVVCSEQRENLALWLGEYDRLRRAIAALRQQIALLDHYSASDAPAVKKRREQELKRLLSQQRDVQDRLERVYEQLDDAQAKLIDSIPGLGPISTAATLVVVRDLSRFDSDEALKAYLGIYPRRNQSGTRERPSHLAHHGNALMRHVLWNAAKAAIRVKHPHNPFRALFERIVAKGKSKVAGFGAVARKLVQVIYGVLKSQTPFAYPSPA
jgi:transposase